MLLESNDLDPVYVLVHEAELDKEELKQWLLAYWCFYHVGTASWIVEPFVPDNTIKGYWRRMEQAAGSKEWPRSAERRHFRGNNAISSVAYLKNRGIDDLFGTLWHDSGGIVEFEVKDVVQYVSEWRGFGPWISFKVADMLERLGLTNISFDIDTAMYESPAKSAEILWQTEHGKTNAPGWSELGKWAVNRVTTELKGVKAPPRYERELNVQEVETILCKHGSYLKGHYHIGEDVEACRRGLLRFAKCRTAQRLLKAGSKGGLW